MKNLETLIQELCPDGVEFVKLGDVCEIKTGKGITQKDCSESSKYPVYSGGKEPMGYYKEYLLAELKNRLKISIFLWRKKLCISLIFSNFVVSNYKVIYFTLCTTCMQIS